MQKQGDLHPSLFYAPAEEEKEGTVEAEAPFLLVSSSLRKRGSEEKIPRSSSSISHESVFQRASSSGRPASWHAKVSPDFSSLIFRQCLSSLSDSIEEIPELPEEEMQD